MTTIRLLVVLILVVGSTSAAAEEAAEEALLKALRDGGHTIYFRHAATDWGDNDRLRAAGDWTSCDPTRMRQLSEAGRETARRIGTAIRDLDIPIGVVLSSEYCRAAETARLLDIGTVETTRDIMNLRAAAYVGGHEAVVQRARRFLAKPPPDGGNRVIVAHGNLMRAATGAYPNEAGSGVFIADAEAKHGFRLVAELTAADWIRLAARFADPK